MPYRIGVISDTHYPTRLPELPYAAIAEVFQGVAQIVHLGDIESQLVLEKLAHIAPVSAVMGDDDAIRLPRKRILEIAGVRIGLVHGQRSLWIERIRPMLLKGLGKPVDAWNGMQTDLLRWFQADNVQAILFGHWHRVYNAWHNGTLLFNPGAVYAMTVEALCWQRQHAPALLRRLIAAHHLRRAMRAPERYQAESTVGILTVHEDGQLTAEVKRLAPILYPR
ncbi:MAG: YfcE family phosphodiesterase [Anaerolineae bacterium]|nr:YfcE family phosphodiesterase [Anaerolineae bacterium]